MGAVALVSVPFLLECIDVGSPLDRLGGLFPKAQAEENRGTRVQFTFKSDFVAALADINDAIRLNGNEASYYVTRASIHESRHDRESALADLDKAIAVDPKSCDAHARRAEIYEEMGELDKAISDCSDVIRLSEVKGTEYRTDHWDYREWRCCHFAYKPGQLT